MLLSVPCGFNHAFNTVFSLIYVHCVLSFHEDQPLCMWGAKTGSSRENCFGCNWKLGMTRAFRGYKISSTAELGGMVAKWCVVSPKPRDGFKIGTHWLVTRFFVIHALWGLGISTSFCFLNKGRLVLLMNKLLVVEPWAGKKETPFRMRSDSLQREWTEHKTSGRGGRR